MLTAGVVAIIRLRRRQSLVYAFGGLAGAGVAILLVRFPGRAQDYFLPGILGSVLTVLACLFSVPIGRPLVAWTSYVARRWPLDRYWHPQVHPAYAEVTLLWTAFFALQLALQIALYQRQATGALATLNTLLGWPVTVVLLAVSYLYGLSRFRHLEGPSLEEFHKGSPPPWQGQRRGF